MRSARISSRRYPALQARVNRYLTILHRFSVAFVYVLIALVIMQIWGINLISWAGATLRTAFGAQIINVGAVLLTLFLVWELTSAAIERYLEAVDATGTRVERSGRARTLLPLLRTAFVVAVALILLLHTMSVMGLDLAPLLATAGVIGIAIGFGSQKLVQDVINGMFILLQDTISVGDVVEVGGHGGTVERMSVRTIELRDASGIVHTIPFSEITTVKNWARGFGYAELDVSVAYGEDVDEVMEVLRQISAELEADPQVGQFMLEPIDVWGVDELAETGVLIKARIKTRPLKQFYVKRQFNRLMKRRFDELGIEIPSRLQTVYLAPDQAALAAPDLSGEAEPAAERAAAPAPNLAGCAWSRGAARRRAVARSPPHGAPVHAAPAAPPGLARAPAPHSGLPGRARAEPAQGRQPRHARRARPELEGRHPARVQLRQRGVGGRARRRAHPPARGARRHGRAGHL